MTATNDGPSVATGVVITDDLPAGTTLLSATPTQGGCSTVGAQEVCAIGTLASGATATVTLTARVQAAAAESPVVNVARTTATTFRPGSREQPLERDDERRSVDRPQHVGRRRPRHGERR